MKLLPDFEFMAICLYFDISSVMCKPKVNVMQTNGLLRREPRNDLFKSVIASLRSNPCKQVNYSRTKQSGTTFTL